MDALIFDTTFLIDFQRERKARPGRAHAFLQANAQTFAKLPVIVWAEFAEGFESVSNPVFLSVVDSFEVLPVTVRTAELYASLVREMRATGSLIGTNDLWIASIALEHNTPLVTRNLEHFGRVRGLEVRSY